MKSLQRGAFPLPVDPQHEVRIQSSLRDENESEWELLSVFLSLVAIFIKSEIKHEEIHHRGGNRPTAECNMTGNIHHSVTASEKFFP